MSKSIKLKNDVYIDASSVSYNKKILADVLYPVGSVYLSVNSTSPATLFGGSWTQISGRFLYCTTTSKTTGGASSIDISHSHTVNSHSHGAGTLEACIGSPSGNAGGIGFYKSNQNDTKIPTYEVQGSSWKTGTLVASHNTLVVGSTGTSTPSTNSKLSSSQSIMPPYFTVYAWYRTS